MELGIAGPIPGSKAGILHPGHTAASPAELDRLASFVILPTPPEFNPAQKDRLEGAYRLMCRTMAGEFAGTGDDYFFMLEVEGQYVSHTAYSVDRSDSTIGIVNFVVTDPAWQRRGFSRFLCRLMVEHFDAHGGKAMYLGTPNPTARRIYLECGFKDYHGHAMRRLTGPADETSFDDPYYAPGEEVSLRPVVWGDGAAATRLFVNRFPWIVRDFSEGTILRPGETLTRSTSIFYAHFGRSEAPGNTMDVLRTRTGHLAGSVSTVARGSEESVLEFMIHPNYAAVAGPLIGRRLGTGRKYVSYAAEGDGTKIGVLRELGFRREGGAAAPSIYAYTR